MRLLLLTLILKLPLLAESRLISFEKPYPTFGSIVRADPALDDIILSNAKIEKLASGFIWAEGPVYVPDGDYVLFSDPKKGTAYKWKEGEGVSVFLKQSGGIAPNPGFKEPGSNGLFLDRDGNLLLCQHGLRRVVRYVHGKFESLADNIDGKRFNSPNDLTVHKNGSIYFTDPPYGLKGGWRSKLREVKFTGVYRVKPGRKVEIISTGLAPNGIGLSPDQKVLYVTHGRSIVRFHLNEDGSVSGSHKPFFDFRAAGLNGGPDGMAIDNRGNVFAGFLGGGVVVISPKGKYLGMIKTSVRTANCAFGDDGHTLYITANDSLVRVRVKTKGL
ncbi:MAG: SMP-30/gluconolactonase/LRE family protein [Planctomycetota bacterium]|jgi:gluconolactonase|nr:SMP-30/gluconolactonase/LRE family protein [Planctomycetota bacterium]MDP7248427.1 SMP-30/gluconolactonase/LRE family protein [Planctomycetota bacterium]